MKNVIMLENIRSAYNVWNIIRTADSLGRDVWMSGYTPWPDEQPKVKKTLETVDAVVYIPMQWIKESMNVGQSSAIFMRELKNN